MTRPKAPTRRCAVYTRKSSEEGLDGAGLQLQQRLGEQGSSHRGRTGKVASSPLMGKLFDEAGNRLTPSHALKDGRRYRYYISRGFVIGTSEEQGWRLPAAQIEKIIAAEATAILADHAAIAAALD